jgi:AcrR family transcriptional regulator
MTDWSVIFGVTMPVKRSRRPRPLSSLGSEAARRQLKRSALQEGGSRPRAVKGSGAQRKSGRRDAILAAAIEEFATRGFAATRLDDVAGRAGVAKGTIYLYFRDKDSLFQELVRTMLSPVVGAIEAAPLADLPVRTIAETIVELFVREVYGTRRKDVLRLILAEGQRFPKLAEFYYREVVSHVMPVMRALFARAVERGELDNAALVRFPQLLIAPALVAVFWNGLFDRFSPLDVRELMHAHLDLIFGKRSGT